MKSIFRILSVTALVFFTAVVAHAQYGNLNMRNTSSVAGAGSIGASVTFEKSVSFVPNPGYPPISPIAASGLVRSGSATIGSTTTLELAGGHPVGYESFSSYGLTDFRFRIGGFGYKPLTAAQIGVLNSWGTVTLTNFFGDGKDFTVTKTYNVSDIEIQVHRTL
jgi:hypothetical protein